MATLQKRTVSYSIDRPRPGGARLMPNEQEAYRDVFRETVKEKVAEGERDLVDRVLKSITEVRREVDRIADLAKGKNIDTRKRVTASVARALQDFVSQMGRTDDERNLAKQKTLQRLSEVANGFFPKGEMSMGGTILGYFRSLVSAGNEAQASEAPRLGLLEQTEKNLAEAQAEAESARAKRNGAATTLAQLLADQAHHRTPAERADAGSNTIE